MKTPEDYVRRELAEAAKRLANARRVMMTSAEAPSKVAGPVGSLGVVGGCLSARDCQRLLRRWTARAEMFRGAWKICRYRDGGPDHAGMLKYDYAATALEAAIREMREQMEAATMRQPTDNGAAQTRRT